MPEVLIVEPMDPAAVQRLVQRFPTRYDPELGPRPGDLRAAAAGCRALVVRNRTRVDRALVDAAPRLRVVGRLGVGLDNIDLEACRGRGIEVIPATGANADSVAEYVLGALLVLFRGVYHASASVLAGAWPRAELAGHEIGGRTLGLVGFGSIARAVAARAQALGMAVAAHDPALGPDEGVWAESGVRSMSLDGLLEASDAVSLHVPLDRSTRGLIGEAAIARMKPGAMLVNTARGGVADEAAVARGLASGRLGGAAFDVFAEEPLPAGSALAGAPNLIATPHVAGITAESNARVSALIAGRVAAWLDGHGG